MLNIDLNLLQTIYEGILFLPYNYWQLFCPLVLSNVIITIFILYNPTKINNHLVDVWRLNSTIYIVILTISLYGTPIVSVLTHMKNEKNPMFDAASVITLWIYLFWSAIMFKIMLMPIYYICHILTKPS